MSSRGDRLLSGSDAVRPAASGPSFVGSPAQDTSYPGSGKKERLPYAGSHLGVPRNSSHVRAVFESKVTDKSDAVRGTDDGWATGGRGCTAGAPSAGPRARHWGCVRVSRAAGVSVGRPVSPTPPPGAAPAPPPPSPSPDKSSHHWPCRAQPRGPRVFWEPGSLHQRGPLSSVTGSSQHRGPAI